MCPNALPSKSWPLFIPPSTSRPALEGGPDANMFFLHQDKCRLASVQTTRNHIKSTSNKKKLYNTKHISTEWLIVCPSSHNDLMNQLHYPMIDDGIWSQAWGNIKFGGINVGKKERGVYKRSHLQDYVETGNIFWKVGTEYVVNPYLAGRVAT